jgi:hypothetical protein
MLMIRCLVIHFSVMAWVYTRVSLWGLWWKNWHWERFSFFLLLWFSTGNVILALLNVHSFCFGDKQWATVPTKHSLTPLQ